MTLSISQLQSRITQDQSQLASINSQITAAKQQQTQLAGQISTLKQEIAADQSRLYALEHPTITGYGQWSTCGSNGQQTRIVYYSNGTTQTQTQSCTPPPPTISGYSGWSPCVNSQQSRHVYYSNGTIEIQTRACTMPVTITGGYWKYRYFNQYTCEFTYQWINTLSNRTTQATSQYKTELKPGCTPTSGSGGIRRTPQ